MPDVLTHASGDEMMASARINLTLPEDLKYLSAVTSVARTSGERAWKWWGEIGEVSGAIGRLGKIAGYAKIAAYKVSADGTRGKKITTGPEADIAKRVSSPYGGVRALIDRYFTLMKVPGEAYLIRCRVYNADGGFEERGYDFLAAEEIDRASLDGSPITGQKGLKAGAMLQRITLPAGASGSNGESITTPIRPEDFIGRVWRPAGRYVDLATSPMRALDVECELLHLLTLGLKGQLSNRIASRGITFIPSEITEVASGTPKADANKFSENQIINRLIQAGLVKIQNPDEPSGALQVFLSGPAQYGEAIRHIEFSREIFATDMELRSELKDRILTGLDVNKQKSKGDGDSNHFQAWADGDDEIRVNIKPDLETLMWAATKMILHREMLEQGLPASRINKTCLWYDLSDAQSNTNAAEDARQAFDRPGIISTQATRRMTGIDDADAPDEAEYIRQVGLKANDPYLATFKLPLAEEIDWTKVGSATKGPNEASPADPAESGPGVKRGGPGQGDSDTPRRLKPAN